MFFRTNASCLSSWIILFSPGSASTGVTGTPPQPGRGRWREGRPGQTGRRLGRGWWSAKTPTGRNQPIRRRLICTAACWNRSPPPPLTTCTAWTRAVMWRWKWHSSLPTVQHRAAGPALPARVQFYTTVTSFCCVSIRTSVNMCERNVSTAMETCQPATY